MSENPFPKGSSGALAWERSFGSPAATAPSPVAERIALVAAHPELDDRAIDRLQSRIASETLRAEVKALGAQIDSDWQAERAERDAESEALARRVFGRAPESEEERQARRAEAIRRENLG